VTESRTCVQWVTSWVLPEKLTVSQLVKKFPTFHSAQRFITAFTTAHHLSVSAAPLIQSAPILLPISQFSIILPITPRFSKWTRVRFRHQNSVCISRVIIRCTIFALHNASLSSHTHTHTHTQATYTSVTHNITTLFTNPSHHHDPDLSPKYLALALSHWTSYIMPLDTTSSGTHKVTELACSSSGQRRI
jgi:hypothetical protein